jgi:hypothetical protein
MPTNLTLNEPYKLKMTKATKRNLYTYQLIGQIQSLQKRTNPKHTQHFYQLNLNCLNNPTVKKLFVFHSKLKNEAIWNALTTNTYLGKKYLFSCRNYRGSYYLVDWEETN